LVYRHELGMNYARVLPNLIVGSCLQASALACRLFYYLTSLSVTTFILPLFPLLSVLSPRFSLHVSIFSYLMSPLDLDHLRDVEGVGAVQCLQRDSDLEYFDLDINPIIERAAERGDIRHLWTEIRDFDPFDLRMQLPRAVAALHKAVMECGTAYVHCTAGLGRAPAVALAYMWWMRDLQLEEANEILQ
ncbi:unnamed protein product, partial [Closterium sp. NIES-53]